MPRFFHGTDAATEARAVAAYLATLKAPGAAAVPSAGDPDAGGRLFETLHCAACHSSPGGDAGDPEKVSLQHVAWKFPEGALQSYLRNPDAHFQWIRMPDFKLNETEAADLAAWLRTKSDAVPDATLAGDAATIDRGRTLIQSVGCLNCHASVEMENQFTAEPLAGLDASAWMGGCLAESPVAGSRVPHFALSAEDREALRAFANSDRESLTRHVPREFAARNLVRLNCAECHGKFDGFPRLELLGGKLKPEWAGPFIRGEIEEKPRPWLEARMPAFATRGALLAEGMAMQHGYPPATPPEPPIDHEAAGIGRKLTGSDGGFSCIACHGVGDFEATAVFEAPGINLALSGDRLRRDFFHLWLTNPLRIEPMTKMPVYFDQGGSPLPEYDGDAARQIRAMWEYVRLGDQMIPPGPAQ
jgi:mono/diheme cytochrome c family protein